MSLTNSTSKLFGYNLKFISYEIGITNSIEVCPINNNLLATAGEDNNIKIFDRREAKIVKTIEFKDKCKI